MTVFAWTVLAVATVVEGVLAAGMAAMGMVYRMVLMFFHKPKIYLISLRHKINVANISHHRGVSALASAANDGNAALHGNH